MAIKKSKSFWLWLIGGVAAFAIICWIAIANSNFDQPKIEPPVINNFFDPSGRATTQLFEPEESK